MTADSLTHAYACTRRYLLPKINNTNVDRSVAMIHSIILRCQLHIARGRHLFSRETGQATLMHKEYSLRYRVVVLKWMPAFLKG